MKIILTAKHWQLFLVIIVLPNLISLGAIPILNNLDPMVAMKVVQTISLFLVIGVFMWFYAVAVGLQSRIPSEVKMNVTLFKVFFIIPIVYFVLSFNLLGFLFDDVNKGGPMSNGGIMVVFLGIMFLLHLFSMYCIAYCFYFVAKTFKTVELQRKTTFSDFGGEFFLFLLFPIGIWILQPRINKMMER